MKLESPKLPDEIIDQLWRMTPCRLAKRLTAGKFKRFDHIKFISEKVTHAVMKGNARIVLSMPPRHGKSWLTSLWTPTWFLGLSPESSVILASYEADFAAHWGRMVHNTITEHSDSLRLSLTDDTKAADQCLLTPDMDDWLCKTKVIVRKDFFLYELLKLSTSYSRAG